MSDPNTTPSDAGAMHRKTPTQGDATSDPKTTPSDPTPQRTLQEHSDLVFQYGAVTREKSEPEYAGFNRSLPGWVIVTLALLLTWSGSYLGAFSGGFRNDVFNHLAGAASGGAAASAGAAPVEKTPVELGKIVYVNNCQSCHQGNGLGQAGVNPPLAGAEWVLGSDKRLGMILLHGLQGPIKVKGNIYNGQMPAWAASLDDKKIANVLTYIRQEWGNAAAPVTAAGIAALRAETVGQTVAYVEADLLAVPDSENLPQ